MFVSTCRLYAADHGLDAGGRAGHAEAAAGNESRGAPRRPDLVCMVVPAGHSDGVCVSVSVCVARVGAAGAAEAVSERRRRRPHEEAAEAHGHGRRGGRRGRRPIAHNSHSLQRSVQTITYCFHIHSLKA